MSHSSFALVRHFWMSDSLPCIICILCVIDVAVALLVEKEQADKAKVQEELQQHLAEAQADVSCCCIC